MTIAISVKVNDGIILSADSASTMIDVNGDIVNIYNNANKIFNLVKGLPIGAITWGAGSMGPASISTLAKDLRLRFSGDPKYPSWHIDPDNYKLENVAALFRSFFYDEIYTPAFASWPQKPSVGFVVAGYSSGEMLAEKYLIVIENGVCPAPLLLWPQEQTGMNWFGQPEAISRLVIGYDGRVPNIIKDELGIDQVTMDSVVAKMSAELNCGMISPAMPIQDAIDLAEYLVEVTVKYSRFTPGSPTVGGPIEIAAISKHEGFKWIERKHYYKEEFNRENP